MLLREFSRNQIWYHDYPLRLALCPFDARMSVIRLPDGQLMLHSPGPIDAALAAELAALGPVGHLVAPGNFHHLHIAQAQSRYPQARTYLCPGVERKQPALAFEWFLGPRPPEVWSDTFDQVLIRGNRLMWEVAMLHRPSKTLLLVDAIENYGEATPQASWQLKAWWKLLRMWNRPGPAPEYRLGWHHKAAARASLEKILAWDFEQILLSHGAPIRAEARAFARRAWAPLLAGPAQS